MGKYTSNEKGRHAELLAQTALIANGYTVLEPVTTEAYDLAVRRKSDGKTLYVQVKTASVRNEERYGGEYVVVKGAKNNGKVYTRDEADYFIAIYGGDVYMFPNREISEYWVKSCEVTDKWTLLPIALTTSVAAYVAEEVVVSV